MNIIQMFNNPEIYEKYDETVKIVT